MCNLVTTGCKQGRPLDDPAVSSSNPFGSKPNVPRVQNGPVFENVRSRHVFLANDENRILFASFRWLSNFHSNLDVYSLGEKGTIGEKISEKSVSRIIFYNECSKWKYLLFSRFQDCLKVTFLFKHKSWNESIRTNYLDTSNNMYIFIIFKSFYYSKEIKI